MINNFRLLIVFIFTLLSVHLIANKKIENFVSKVESNPDYIIQNWKKVISDPEIKENNKEKLLVYYAVSNAYRIKGDYKNMMLFANKADELVTVGLSTDLIVKHKIFLGSRYTILKLYGRAEDKFKSVYTQLNTLPEKNKDRLKIELLGQYIFLYGMQSYDDKLIPYFDTIVPLTKKVYATEIVIRDRNLKAIYYNKALTYTALKKIDSSQYYLKLAINLPHIKEDLLTDAYINSKIGEQFLEKKNIDSAKYYINQSIVGFTEIGDNYGLYRSYSILNEMLSKNKNQEYYDVLEKLREVELKLNDSERKAVDEEFLKIQKTNTKLNENNTNYFYVVLVVAILLIIVTFIFIKKRRKQASQENIEIDPKNTDNNKGEEFSISKEIEIDLLKKLDDFENSTKYTNPNLSLSTLAGQFKTNTQYLSFVINKNKKKNFNTYVNELRIFYIQDKLKTEKIYKSYKIAHLADLAGFSNHSVFAKVFKQVTGIPPSQFIKELTEDVDSNI